MYYAHIATLVSEANSRESHGLADDGFALWCLRWLAPHDADWDGDMLLVDPGIWHADDGYAEMEFEVECGADAAQEYVDGGDWGDDCDTTSWVHVRVWREGIDETGAVRVDAESHRIAIEPIAPDCIDGHDHEWISPHSIVGGIKENPGVWGHGGGVIIHEVCKYCGCGMSTDTWAQDPENGEQGLRAVTYTEGEFTDQINERHIRRAKERLECSQDDIDALIADRGYDPDDVAYYDFVFIDQDGDLVGIDDDDLRDFGIALLDDEDATPVAPEISLGAS